MARERGRRVGGATRRAAMSGALGGGGAQRLALFYAVAFLERADEALLPACYAAVGRSFGATPAQLGLLTSARAALQALASLPAGAVADRSDRCAVVGGACVVWGVLSLLVALSPTLGAVLVLRAVTGAALAAAIPATQSVLADSFADERRGRGFGWLHIISYGGTAVAAAVMAPLSTASVPMWPLSARAEGWRVAFVLVGGASVVAGIALAKTVDVRYTRLGANATGMAGSGTVFPDKDATWADTLRWLVKLSRNTVHGVSAVVRVQTLQVVCAQGAVGSIPWKALLFMTMYLQTAGFSDGEAGFIMGAWLAGNAFGGMIGGYVGDFWHIRWPSGGRTATAQTSVLLGMPGAYLIFRGLGMPLEHPSSDRLPLVTAYACVALLTALCCSWCGNTNNSMMSAVVPPERYCSIFAFDRCFEGLISSFSSVGVGALAEARGWRRGAPAGSADNARALGDAVVLACMVPWILCFSFYGLLYWVYPRDVARLRKGKMRVPSV